MSANTEMVPAGLVLAALGADVTATDLEPNLALLNKNADANSALPPVRVRCCHAQ